MSAVWCGRRVSYRERLLAEEATAHGLSTHASRWHQLDLLDRSLGRRRRSLEGSPEVHARAALGGRPIADAAMAMPVALGERFIVGDATSKGAPL